MTRQWLEQREKAVHDGYLAIQNDKTWLDHPCSVSLETYSKCNAACTFCPYPGLDRIGQKLDDKVVYRIIDELAAGVHPNLISMAKINEPLLDTRFFDFCAYINEKLPETGIALFSNGSTLHEKMINRLIGVKNLRFLVISLNDHRPAEYEASMKISYEKTMRRVRPLHERKVQGEIPFPIALTRVGDGTAADQDFIRFLNAIERDIQTGKTIHAIVDNYATHKHPKVRAWLERHPRWTFHFIPTSSSWLNAVEGFFAKLTRRRLKYGVFHSIVDLQAAINRFIAEHNDEGAKPFVWRADPDEIIAARNRGFQMLDSIH